MAASVESRCCDALQVGAHIERLLAGVPVAAGMPPQHKEAQRCYECGPNNSTHHHPCTQQRSVIHPAHHSPAVMQADTRMKSIGLLEGCAAGALADRTQLQLDEASSAGDHAQLLSAAALPSGSQERGHAQNHDQT